MREKKVKSASQVCFIFCSCAVGVGQGFPDVCFYVFERLIQGNGMRQQGDALDLVFLTALKTLRFYIGEQCYMLGPQVGLLLILLLGQPLRKLE